MKLSVIDNHRSRFTAIAPGWQQRKMKAAVYQYQTKKNLDDNPTVLSLTKSGLKVKTDLAFGKSTESYVGHQIVQEGQFVFTPRDFDATPILCGVAETGGCISNLYIVFSVSREIAPRFLEYYFWGLKYGFDFFEKLSFGMRYSFNRTQFENIPLIYPDLSTQRAIANFLDRETARIDTLIEKKQRFVELLGEKAKAQQLFLVSGQGKAEKKKSKISWSPWIPQEWEERAVWMLFELGRGRVISYEYISENSGEYPIYSSQTSDDGVMGYINTFDFEGEYLTWTTDGAKAGTVFRRDGRFNCTNVCGTLRPLNKQIDLSYVRFALDGATDFFVRHDINPKLMNGVMAKIRIPFPPPKEQTEIGQKISEIEKMVAPVQQKTEASIDRLKEYRSALITSAVTGQIDVTKWTNAGTNDRQLDAIEEEFVA